MTTTVQPTAATKRVPMDSLRKTALVAGALYLITFATSIPARILFGPVGTIRTTSSAQELTRRCSSLASST